MSDLPGIALLKSLSQHDLETRAVDVRGCLLQVGKRGLRANQSSGREATGSLRGLVRTAREPDRGHRRSRCFSNNHPWEVECRSRRDVDANSLLRFIVEPLIYPHCNVASVGRQCQRRAQKAGKPQDIPLFGSLTLRCSARYSVRDREVASCDTRNIAKACLRASWHTATGQRMRKAS